MKFLNLYIPVVTALLTGFSNAQGYGYTNEVNPVDEYIKTLEPVLNLNTMVDPFNLVANAQVNVNQTLSQYEGLYNESKDECLRACYSYSIHLLEISYNLNCDSKFSKINSEYKSNKPCYKASPSMQNVLDNGNAYLDLFCSKDEKNTPCTFVTDIVKIPDNSTIIEQVCKNPENKRNKCDKSLVQNLSIMVDSSTKLNDIKNATYSSGGKKISLNTPSYNLTSIENQLKNNTCLAKIEEPKMILVNVNETEQNKNDTNTSDMITVGPNMNSFIVLLTISLIALLF
ncbi:hypothetical protein BCR36DRAFT_585977 [Piromyces finnis]|uniref:Uncharacterized protein n=1 Tax=Piromyces finnis TaxID=1754191 RepID=A0A1Y1V1B7_9FUNG|nr:hypothetical protein BCR36DRAFT_585977 [Piromyces finnis]|eukprot:ORX44866.1 hypothetical protein BCR36DRAFT_585977 [Piromyces finnis]